MAALLNIDYQKFIQLPDGFVVGIHKVTPIDAVGDTILVPDLADPVNAGRSASQLRRAGDTATTISTTGVNTITIVGTPGVQCTIVSLHSKHTSSSTDPF